MKAGSGCPEGGRGLGATASNGGVWGEVTPHTAALYSRRFCARLLLSNLAPSFSAVS